jgi:hypothetical protein
MANLIDGVRRACKRLGPLGWRNLLRHHDLNIEAANLEDELARPLGTIDRRAPGFEDFALEGVRGIEPGRPARSLLYHALASPNVLEDHQGHPLKGFPTLAEIELVENYVFAMQQRSLAQIRALVDGNLAIAVFSCEYRPASATVHRRHADLCFARTGIARVGTNREAYDPAARGFLPFVNNKPFEMRVLPARYAPFLAAQFKGRSKQTHVMNAVAGDDDRDFWIPITKLFDGPECLPGLDLTVALEAHHRNEKLRRIHVAWKGKGGWTEPDISKPPFVFEDGIAAFSTRNDDGTGLLCPTPHPLVEAAQYQGHRLTFKVPPNSPVLSSSVYIEPGDRETRSAPEFVHARHLVNAKGGTTDLNSRPDVAAFVAAGGYDAQHYVDYTGDGWIDVSCPQLAVEVPRRVPAYSLVTAPDFFVACDQRELFEWTEQSVRSSLRLSMWAEPPTPLNDKRLAPNLALTDRFVSEDKTPTAIVSLASTAPLGTATGSTVAKSFRHSHLPDAAAGLFDPGWDVSRDSTHGVAHLAAYGLGSPFPEDAKLCAALSTFWPAVAPDAARTFEPNPKSLNSATPTVAPLTDEEIGLGKKPSWDGLAGPRRVVVDGKELVEYPDIDHTDYVAMAAAGKFSLAQTGLISTEEYEARVLATARAYRSLGIRGGSQGSQLRKKGAWAVLSFQRLTTATKEVKSAEGDTGTAIELPAFRFEMYRHGKRHDHPTDVTKARVEMHQVALLIVNPAHVVVKHGARPWALGDE